MVDLAFFLTNLLFCVIPFLYFYTNLNSSLICCFSFGDISNTRSFMNNFITIISPVTSTVFWIALFEAVFISSVVDFLAVSRKFLRYLLHKPLLLFLAKVKIPHRFYIFHLWVQLNISFCTMKSHLLDISLNH